MNNDNFYTAVDAHFVDADFRIVTHILCDVNKMYVYYNCNCDVYAVE